ncbi:hypothetical protein SAMN05443287_105263 [Micromonospora phaseoli]|uniref:Uncharacterized protein n=1 Tax=Micromonospora phaseoli TaxID=1144548 RepID=A0A1H6ZS52_9ACTN|nr:hypothetical protein [Micromonospora phaseoli]PZV97041.1 hypothetical protein CLV64_106149 [Micromonospora phaseoli]GIJ77381.1 hypothetical protein Xph01_18130 [Micromonospora phaseoli]SEJ56309.1 hypothetical protein SAMN05443287_105263 [Micromonospora phaseoli]
MRTLRIAAAALIVCTALAACGGQDAGDGSATPTPTGASPVTELPTPDPTGSAPPPSDPVDPTAPTTRPTVRPSGPTKPPTTGEVTLTGRIDSGVEPGCLLLDGYLLLGGPRDVLTAGATVTVTGRADPSMMTTCQQGTPFVVASAKRG